MLHFENDYNEGMHPELMAALVATNEENLAGYGGDHYSQSAARKIAKACDCPHAEVFFLSGGTQTNQVVIDSVLQPYQGVIAPETGHISVHEAGAIEFTGHKVLTLPHQDGKISATDVDTYIKDFYQDGNYAHMVIPGMVYITHPTEYGTLYSKEELEALAEVCRAHGLPLFLDGARLGYGLAVEGTDVDLPTIAKNCDVFYIGGTKMGSLSGEAVVFTKNNMPKHFTPIVKQHGALTAKSRIYGVQFDRFFTDDLYLEIGRHGVEMAEQLKQILEEKGYRFFFKSPTNQQFIIMENHKLEELSQVLVYSFWQAYDEHHTVIRLATSWSTTQEDMDKLREVL